MPVRPRFDPKRTFNAARDFIFAGRSYASGDPFPDPDDAGLISDRMIARQYEARAINMAPADPSASDPVQMTGPDDAHRYTITAPWMDDPLVIRGKDRAETALAELREEGRPLGWIAGGTAVEVEALDGGWYEVSAPWLDEPEKLQGRTAAEKRQLEIHDAGEPAYHHGVTLTEAESGNGYYEIKADWLADNETVHGIDAARERAADLRDEGAPEGWTPEQGLAAEGDAGENAGEQGGENPADPDAAGEADQGAADADEKADNAETEKAADTAEGTDQAADEGAADESGQSGGVVGATGVDGDQGQAEDAVEDTSAPALDVDPLVTSTHTGGGYYEVAAPWLDEGIRVRGKDASEAERLKIVEAGPPEGWAPAAS